MGRSTRLQVLNQTVKPRTVWVEPWGEDFTVLPGDRLEIIAHNGSEAPGFSVVEGSVSTEVFLEAASSFEALHNGTRVQCGFNRPAAARSGG